MRKILALALALAFCLPLAAEEKGKIELPALEHEITGPNHVYGRALDPEDLGQRAVIVAGFRVAAGLLNGKDLPDGAALRLGQRHRFFPGCGDSKGEGLLIGVVILAGQIGNGLNVIDAGIHGPGQDFAHLIHGKIGNGQRCHRFIAGQHLHASAPVVERVQIVSCGADGIFLHTQLSEQSNDLIGGCAVVRLAGLRVRSLCLDGVDDLRNIRHYGNLLRAVDRDAFLRSRIRRGLRPGSRLGLTGGKRKERAE